MTSESDYRINLPVAAITRTTDSYTEIHKSPCEFLLRFPPTHVWQPCCTHAMLINEYYRAIACDACRPMLRFVGAGRVACKDFTHAYGIALPAFTFASGGPSSSIGMATGYGLDGPGIEFQLGRDFSHTSRPALGPTQPPV
jgi:hypothetical protein